MVMSSYGQIPAEALYKTVKALGAPVIGTNAEMERKNANSLRSKKETNDLINGAILASAVEQAAVLQAAENHMLLNLAKMFAMAEEDDEPGKDKPLLMSDDKQQRLAAEAEQKVRAEAEALEKARLAMTVKHVTEKVSLHMGQSKQLCEKIHLWLDKIDESIKEKEEKYKNMDPSSDEGKNLRAEIDKLIEKRAGVEQILQKLETIEKALGSYCEHHKETFQGKNPDPHAITGLNAYVLEQAVCLADASNALAHHGVFDPTKDVDIAAHAGARKALDEAQQKDRVAFDGDTKPQSERVSQAIAKAEKSKTLPTEDDNGDRIPAKAAQSGPKSPAIEAAVAAPKQAEMEEKKQQQEEQRSARLGPAPPGGVR